MEGTFKIPMDTLMEYKMTQGEMDDVWIYVRDCFPIPTKSGVLDYLETKKNKRAALLAAMYIGHLQC